MNFKLDWSLGNCSIRFNFLSFLTLFFFECRYIVSFISPVFEVIRYADTDSPNLGEIYETFDSMLGEMKRIINAKDPSFYEGHIRPIIEKR